MGGSRPGHDVASDLALLLHKMNSDERSGHCERNEAIQEPRQHSTALRNLEKLLNAAAELYRF